MSSRASVASLRYRAMKGTVAPPSSSSTAAVTWRSRTPSSSAIRWLIGTVIVFRLPACIPTFLVQSP